MVIYLAILGIVFLYMIIGSQRLNLKNTGLQVRSGFGTIVASKEKIRVLFVFSILWFLTAFRGQKVGNDTQMYLIMYKYIKSLTYFSDIFHIDYMEEGFHLFMYVIGQLPFESTQVIIIVSASISYGVLFYYILKESSNLYLSLCVAFSCCYSIFINTTRQGLAIALCMISYFEFRKKHYKGSIILIFIASFFHLSAIAMFLIYLHNWMSKDIKKLMLINISVLFFSVVIGFRRFFMILVPRYANYFVTERVGSGYLALTVQLVIEIYLLYVVHKCYKNKSQYSLELAISEFAVLFVILAFNMNLISRVVNYFNAILVIELPNALCHKGIGGRTLAIRSCGLLMMWFLTVLIFRREWSTLYPYSLWLGNSI